MTTAEITQMLRQRYGNDQWAFVAEVANGSGAGARRCDALAMGMWPSKGFHLHGHEIKVSRNDWLTEIQDPTKAAAFSVYCHYWWIVAPPKVVKLEELPSDWGLMCPTKQDNLRVKKAATLKVPELPTHSMLAGIFRACCKSSASAANIGAAWAQGYSKGIDEATERQSDSTTNNYEYERLKQSVQQFEVASGIRIKVFGNKGLGELVKAVQLVEPSQLMTRLESMNDELSQARNGVAQSIMALQQLLSEPV